MSTGMQSFIVRCVKCKAERPVKIHRTAMGEMINWMETPDNQNHPICSGRKRLDDQWGWQCLCGNNSLMTDQERSSFTNPASPKPKEIDEIVKNLKPSRVVRLQDRVRVDRFEMVSV